MNTLDQAFADFMKNHHDWAIDHRTQLIKEAFEAGAKWGLNW